MRKLLLFFGVASVRLDSVTSTSSCDDAMTVAATLSFEPGSSASKSQCSRGNRRPTKFVDPDALWAPECSVASGRFFGLATCAAGLKPMKSFSFIVPIRCSWNFVVARSEPS